jgi:uncharacterized membrane protein
MEIGGLPLHPLVIHTPVVLTPLAALCALAYACIGGWRDRLRWPMLVLAVLATASVVAAYLTGRNLLESRPALGTKPLVMTHEDRATLLLWVALSFGVVAVVTAWLHARTGAAQVVLRVVLTVVALAVLVQVVRTGDAGSRAVWEVLG